MIPNAYIMLNFTYLPISTVHFESMDMTFFSEREHFGGRRLVEVHVLCSRYNYWPLHPSDGFLAAWRAGLPSVSMQTDGLVTGC